MVPRRGFDLSFVSTPFPSRIGRNVETGGGQFVFRGAGCGVRGSRPRAGEPPRFWRYFLPILHSRQSFGSHSIPVGVPYPFKHIQREDGADYPFFQSSYGIVQAFLSPIGYSRT